MFLLSNIISIIPIESIYLQSTKIISCPVINQRQIQKKKKKKSTKINLTCFSSVVNVCTSLSVIYTTSYKRLVPDKFFFFHWLFMSHCSFFCHILCFALFHEPGRSSEVITAGPVNQFFLFFSRHYSQLSRWQSALEKGWKIIFKHQNMSVNEIGKFEHW